MFNSYIFTQQYWWLIVSLLGAILVFLMFVQGGQTLIYSLGKTKSEKNMLVSALGRKWGLTFTTLVTFGGAFFASFPLFYSTSFGGAYWVWIIILFSFVIQAVSYEFRSKANNLLGQKIYDIFLIVNGLLGTILLGTAVATFFTGSEFLVEKMNITNIDGQKSVVISQWTGAAHGLEAALNPHNLLLGLSVFFLARILGALFFLYSVDNDAIKGRIKKQLIINVIPFLLVFLPFVIWLLLRDGFAVDPVTGDVFMQANKYLTNFIEMPLVSVIFVVGVLLVLFGIYLGIFKLSDKAFWFSGGGTVLTVLALLLIAGYNNTAFYPSTTDLNYSLTIYNSSSSPYTLKVMSYVSLFIPVVIAYIWVAWRAISRKKIDLEEINNEAELY
ncbi:MAG TPA: cytochrome d ubiquinol oxidase subunit II [Salinivirgaceae bacterium]|nr:cytochrome d ubiquinol oxidase subunit II [Salinivirgaceae bacterium]